MSLESPLNAALRIFEAAEENLVKAEKVWRSVLSQIPNGIAFGDDPNYQADCSDLYTLVEALPLIDGWRPALDLMDLDQIAQARLDAEECGEIEYKVSVEKRISEPEKLLAEYRYRFNKKRRMLVRDELLRLVNAVDESIRMLKPDLDKSAASNTAVDSEYFFHLQDQVDEIAMLLGSSPGKPARWGDLSRHLSFGQIGDLYDIVTFDWPSVRAGLSAIIYGERDPIPVDIEDLGNLITSKPKGAIATKLKWDLLTDEDFERLLFALISSTKGYENPGWLTRTNASDRGRDLSADRLHVDELAGTTRLRTIIQCKHWQSKSVGVAEIALLREQMKLWEPPLVDVHVIATSGRFTTDAVQLIESQNKSDAALRIEMWPESHLERLLGGRPDLISQFHLR